MHHKIDAVTLCMLQHERSRKSLPNHHKKGKKAVVKSIEEKALKKKWFLNDFMCPPPPKTMDYMWEGYTKLEIRSFAKMLENMSRKVSQMSS